MRMLFGSIVIASTMLAAIPAQAGFWGYAQCVAEKRAWMGQHGMTAWSMLTPVMIGTSFSCFEAY